MFKGSKDIYSKFCVAGPLELRPLGLGLAPHPVVFPGQGGDLGQPGLAVRPQPAQDRVGQAGGLRQLHLRHREHGAARQHLLQPQGSRYRVIHWSFSI